MTITQKNTCIDSGTVRFVLSKQQWKVFFSALDKPARVIPKLKRLFKKDVKGYKC